MITQGTDSHALLESGNGCNQPSHLTISVRYSPKLSFGGDGNSEAPAIWEGSSASKFQISKPKLRVSYL